MIERKFYLGKIKSGFAVVPIVLLIGARQVGKTSLMKMFNFNGASLFLNGQDPEISGLFERLNSIEDYIKVYLNPDLTGLLMIDEFQFIPGISTMLKLLTDKNEGLKILCSGSSSLDIQQTVEESLAGRIRVIEVLSLSFEEYLKFTREKLHMLYENFGLTTPDSALTAPFHQALKEYMLYGGLPRAALIHDYEQKLAILDDIYKTYLVRDVRSYIKNEHFTGFNRLLKMLASQVGNMVNINSISRETGLPYRACDEYMDLLQQMYIIKLIAPFSSNKRSAITKMKKIYFTDLGLRNMISSGFQEMEYRADKGALFENFILLELFRNLKPGGNIYYFRTTDGTEVDFIVQNPTSSYAVECKYAILQKPLKIRALNSLSGDENLINCYIINQNFNFSEGTTHHIQGYLAGFINR
ncbi:MAG TPA: ATP-binding protein [Bacteroidales bacterium]|jgi:predicted AAA+ superfamily ATPase|nr:ATP-binding protein [Bacteroidales bacterium]HOX78277.1 ATP-binding protein [Bacteroidales bacterium]HPI85428.1 ATP-binding protein [Bacteroidales bacterium]HPM91858.1 ATP-binding protein [Bacteroidales bacterium]